MLKNKILGFGFLSAVLVMLAISAFALNFRAQAAAPSVSATTTVHAFVISTKSGTVFKRTAITVVLRETFEFTNETGASQTVTSHGKAVATVATKSSTIYKFAKPGKYVFSLASNAKAILTITVK